MLLYTDEIRYIKKYLITFPYLLYFINFQTDYLLNRRREWRQPHQNHSRSISAPFSFYRLNYIYTLLHYTNQECGKLAVWQYELRYQTPIVVVDCIPLIELAVDSITLTNIYDTILTVSRSSFSTSKYASKSQLKSTSTDHPVFSCQMSSPLAGSRVKIEIKLNLQF